METPFDCGPQPSETLPSRPDQKPDGVADAEPWIRYRAEYRDTVTDDILAEKVSRSDDWAVNDNTNIDEPVFELVTRYKSRKSVGTNDDSTTPSLLGLGYTKHLNLFSPAIINALKSVVEYYPSQDLTGNPVEVKYPYAILVHHYDELKEFGEACKAKAPEDLCAREVHANSHVGMLLKFLDDNIMEDVRLEQQRNKNGTRTWELLWVNYKPGRTFVGRFMGQQGSNAGVVHSVHGGTFSDPPKPWMVMHWCLGLGGQRVGRVSGAVNTYKFDGEKRDDDTRQVWYPSLRHFQEASENKTLPQHVRDKVEYGRMWWNLRHKQCRNYVGRCETYPHNEVKGLVMVDPDTDNMERPPLMDSADTRIFSSDCICSVCQRRRVKGQKRVRALFENYDSIYVKEDIELTDHMYLLCPFTWTAFVFKTRLWESLHVRGFSEPEFQEDMINGLVMDSRRKSALKALAKSFARRNRFGQELEQSMWSADFVRGKGSGLIFLLHGVPGVGKTCTAECISAFTRRPLMVLTPSDIGTTPEDAEKNLTQMFKRARRWDAVLLIDEADVFMERRTAADLVRNSLVAGFLRALENFDGILFLTTNRVGAFDDAFRSRVHVQLYYPEFTEDQRQQVWKTFIEKLAKERGDSIRLNIDAKEYIRGAEVRALEWNGRDIRNAFQTAVALAEYDAEKDEEGKVLVTDTHLRAVAEFSRDFKDYLQTLHKGNEATRAQRKFERNDGFAGTPSAS